MSEESSLLVQEYYKSSQFLREMKDFTVTKTIGNIICDDSITIFLKIQDNIIVDYSYT